MVSPQIVAELEDVVVRFRRFSLETHPELVWGVVSDLNGVRAVDKKLRVSLKSQAREAYALLTVRADAGERLLVAGGAEVMLPASDEILTPVFDAIIGDVLVALDDSAPATRRDSMPP